MNTTDDKNMELRILEAAEQLFLEQGFTRTTTEQIAQQAGCNQALVHYYYRTKDKLFNRIFEEKVRLLASNFLNIKNKGITFEEKLKSLIEGHFDFLANNPKLPPFIYKEMTDNPARVKSMIEEIVQYPKELLLSVEKDLEIEKAKGTIRNISAIDLLFTVVSLNVMPFLMMPVFQFALNIPDEQVGAVMSRRKEEIVRVIMDGIRTNPACGKIL